MRRIVSRGATAAAGQTPPTAEGRSAVGVDERSKSVGVELGVVATK